MGSLRSSINFHFLSSDIDECLDVTCGENATCVNTEGNYSCQCDTGFTGDGYNCTGLVCVCIHVHV